MYLSTQEIAASRNRVLGNLLNLTSACIEAGQRMTTLFAAASRDALHHGGKHLAQVGHGQLETMTQASVNFWLENSIRQSRLLDSAYCILGEAHKALIESTEAQIRVLDAMAFTGIRRTAKSSPWEVEIALGVLRTSLESAEKSLHEISLAAADTVDQASQEMHQLSAGLSDPKAVQKAAAPRSRSKTG